MANLYPDKLINYRVYKDGATMLGEGTVDLPEIAYMVDTLSGAGIAGEIETPVIGHIQSMSTTINWRTINKDAIDLLKTSGALLTFRASQQQVQADTNALQNEPVKILMRVLPKTTTLGSAEVGATTDSSTELEVTYLKIEIGNENMLEIDKVNFKFIVRGEDRLASVRSDLGM